MTTAADPPSRPPIVYPDTDGKPIAENTLQFEWIAKIKGGLDYLSINDPNVFVAGDLFWYPVEGHPEIVTAPDALVAFGRPKGDRMSYMQWEEGGIPPQVVFEVLSHINRPDEMQRKFEFYRQYRVEEYYIVNPDPQRLEFSGFLRRDNSLVEIPLMNGHVSPRLGVRFELSGDGLRIIRPDGRPFLTYGELAKSVEKYRQPAEQYRQEAEQYQQRAEQYRKNAEQYRQNAEQALADAEQLRQRLRSLGEDPGE